MNKRKENVRKKLRKKRKKNHRNIGEKMRRNSDRENVQGNSQKKHTEEPLISEKINHRETVKKIADKVEEKSPQQIRR